jgi:hypothetical protein
MAVILSLQPLGKDDPDDEDLADHSYSVLFIVCHGAVRCGT